MISLDINKEASEVLRSKDTVYSQYTVIQNTRIQMFICSTGSGHYFRCNKTVKHQKILNKKS